MNETRRDTEFDLKGRTVAIIGAAATGCAAAPVLARRGARVLVYDARSAAELGEAPGQLDLPGVELRFGDAAGRGIEEADLVVPSPGVPGDSPALLAAHAHGIPVRAEIEVASSIARAPVIAVTGTNGKTTTVLMIAAALRAGGRDVTVGGNTLAGGYQVPLIAAADQTPGTGWIVAEVSSFQLERTTAFRPRVAVITNISADHMNRHGSMAAYAAAKSRILAAQGEGDWAVLNLDNDLTAALVPQARGKLLLFSRRDRPTPGAWVEGTGADRRIRAGVNGGEVEILDPRELRVPGEHNVENAMAAALAALATGVGAAEVGRGLVEFPGVADRLEYVATVRGVIYVNNTMCTNVDAAIRSLEAYSQPVVLIAGGMDKGSDFGPLGQAIARRVRHLVVIGQHGERIAASARSAGHAGIESAGSMEEAVEAAAGHALPGDVVLLAPACASFDWYSSFEERGAVFKRAVAALRERAA